MRGDAGRFMAGANKSQTLAAAKQLESFESPVLLAWASEDRVFPLAYAERLAEAMPERPDRRGRRTPGRSSPLDQPERVADAIRGFVETADRLSRFDPRTLGRARQPSVSAAIRKSRHFFAAGPCVTSDTTAILPSSWHATGETNGEDLRPEAAQERSGAEPQRCVRRHRRLVGVAAAAPLNPARRAPRPPDPPGLGDPPGCTRLGAGGTARRRPSA